MRKLLLVLGSAAVGSILTAIVLEPRAAAVGGQGGEVEKCSVQNGDVNVDGKIDLADPVTILGHLFLGNPQKLVPLCAAPRAPSGLPDTGQTKCYAQTGVEISCDRALCSGQDSSYATGCPSEKRFDDHGDGTVSDTCTGLMWQKDTADPPKMSWCDALAYCEDLNFADHEDWRLPNVRELQSIVDYGRFNPAIDPAFGAMPYFYVSSTTIAAYPELAWGVNFDTGHVTIIVKSGKDRVRAVRTAP